MSTRAPFQRGDVVVRRETREGSVVYVLHAAPGPDQYLLRTYEEAVVYALGYAEHRYVKAWFVADNDDAVLLGAFIRTGPFMPADAVDVVQEARSLLATRANLLLTGPEPITSEALQSMRPSLQQPVWETEAEPLSLPTASTGTLIIRHGARLRAEDQVRLLQWMGQHRSTQLITVTLEPLFPLVTRGTFFETLFYKLNTVQVAWEDRA